MNLHITGKNFDLTEAIKNYTQQKIGQVNLLHDQIIETRVTLEHDRHDHAESFRVIVNCHIPHDDIHCESEAPDLYAAIDIAKDEFERQLLDRKEKWATKQREAQQQKRDMKSIV